MGVQAKTIAFLVAKPGQEAALQSLLRDLAAASRSEPGNVSYEVWRDRDEPRRFVLDELYTGDEAITAHRATPHFQDYLSRIGDLADRQAVVAHPIDVA
ncbi:putative quinol monooxygenase [Caulobacter sp. 602-1]|uniref:putative quinol monooxygenase n=1 Tax=Caulobacter sp. 602-1 TaxID=2492472 RepID=UPI000F639FAE|nr:putative quinol monooxygenase [Caulobacter sp. 602-1]RRN63868.1 antibiotic biosynthesis monooxygenase [Caulobacter sp. 602-1]